ncbi:unnamed protein product [Malus baccata var. baccata]
MQSTLGIDKILIATFFILAESLKRLAERNKDQMHWLLDYRTELVYYMDLLNWIQIDPGMKDIFKEKATYTQQEIDALRIEWAEYVDDFIPINETLD